MWAAAGLAGAALVAGGVGLALAGVPMVPVVGPAGAALLVTGALAMGAGVALPLLLGASAAIVGGARLAGVLAGGIMWDSAPAEQGETVETRPLGEEATRTLLATVAR